MEILPVALQIAALVCFAMVFFRVNVPKERPMGWIGAGLFLWLVSYMIVGQVALHAAH